jgi:hypothetical protein
LSDLSAAAVGFIERRYATAHDFPKPIGRTAKVVTWGKLLGGVEPVTMSEVE